MKKQKAPLTFRLILIVFLLYLGFSSLGENVWAQSFSLTISPPLTEITSKPGQTISQVYKISNLTDPQTIKPRLLRIKEVDELGNIKPEDESSPSPWINFSFEEGVGQGFFLGQSESREIKLNINIKGSTPEGDYYYTLLLESLLSPQTVKKEGQVRIQSGIGTIILITVSKTGQPVKEARVETFRLPFCIFSSCFNLPVNLIDSGNLTVILKVQNLGAAFFKPIGEIIIRSPLGLETKYPFLPENVLAKTTRIIATGKGGNGQSLTIPGFFLGPYRLIASFSLSEDGPTVLATTYFFALPFKIILAVLIILPLWYFVNRRK